MDFFKEILEEAREIKISKDKMKKVKRKDLIRDYKGKLKPKRPAGYTVVKLPSGKQVFIKKKKDATVKIGSDGKPVYSIDKQASVQRSRRMKRISKRTARTRLRHAKLTRARNK